MSDDVRTPDEGETAIPGTTAQNDRGHGTEDGQAVTRSGGIELPMVGSTKLDRREAIKILGLAAAAGAAGLGTAGCEPGDPLPTGRTGAQVSGEIAARESAGFEGANYSGNPMARGWPWDPDLITPSRPWDLVLTEDERQGIAVLCDMIIPADDVSPAASEVGCVDFIDEWVSAPYDGMRNDLVLVRGGLAWLDREATTRFGDGLRFRDLTLEQRTAICDDISYRPRTAPEHMYGSRFFDKVRDLTATAFYTTEEGMDDIGYVGNVPLPSWGPPPPEVLRHLGLEDA